ncbi:MAG: DUF6362 family protein [Pseudomonadota bacterium]|nr:DUF6362 family protein [Pseudomonadota bacterium]
MSNLDLHNALLVMAAVHRCYPPARPREFKCAWPDVLEDAREAYGYNETDPVRFVPDADQIDIAEQVWRLLNAYPDEEDRRLVCAVIQSAIQATGFPRERGPRWRMVAKLMHRDWRTIKRRYENILTDIVLRM